MNRTFLESTTLKESFRNNEDYTVTVGSNRLLFHKIQFTGQFHFLSKHVTWSFIRNVD
jgi:hypothetical protein